MSEGLIMDLDKIMSLKRVELEIVLRRLDIECIDGTDEDELQALLFSFASSHENFDKVYELCCLFDDQPFELINSLVESSGNIVSEDVLGALLELSTTNGHIYPVVVNRIPSEKTLQIKVRVGTSLVFLESIDNGEDGAHNGIVIAEGNQKKHRVVVPDLTFGHHELQLTHTIPRKYPSRACYTYNVFVSSPVYSYCMSLDAMLDRLYWGWEGHWSPEMENALLELLVSVESDLVPLVIRLNEMMGGMMGGESGKELEVMLNAIQEDMSNAFTTHSTYAVGRLHQTLLQLREMNSSGMGSMISIPESLIRAIDNFIQIKVQSSPQRILSRELNALILSAQAYSGELRQNRSITGQAGAMQEPDNIQTLLHVFNERVGAISVWREQLRQVGEGAAPGNLSKLHSEVLSGHFEAVIKKSMFLYPINENALDALDMYLGVLETKPLSMDEINALHSFKPSQLSSLMQQQSAPGITSSSRSKMVTYLPVLPLDDIVDCAKLDAYVSNQAECLVQDVLHLDSILGYSISRAVDRTTTCALLTSMLNSGLTYVLSHSSKLMGLFPCTRAVLILSDSLAWRKCYGCLNRSGHADDIQNPLLLPMVPKSLTKRLKDMPRIFRNKMKKQLSLRLNTDISFAICKLREHHGDDCWVTKDLECVWKLMATTSPPMLMVFELWYGDCMIAADFAHPVCGGRSVYVATRFFDKRDEYKTLQPGFVLALAECAYLRTKGCLLWDLGGVNLCPLMRYKNDLTGKPYARSDALFIFTSAREMSLPEGMCCISSSGILIENITADCLSIINS